MSAHQTPSIPPFATPRATVPPIPEFKILSAEVPPWSRSAIYRLHLLGAPVLVEECEEVQPERDAKYLPALAHAMTAIVERFGGWGLAANQVGAAVRVVVLRLENRLNGPLITLINPFITTRSIEMKMMEESCLSIPNFTRTMLRHKKVGLRYLDEEFVEQKADLFGYSAQACQHEIEHLNGRVLTDGANRKQVAHAEALVAKAREKLGL